MRLTIIHPCIGRHAGDRTYIRTWQMEPLPAATLAGLTPKDVAIRFYDDRRGYLRCDFDRQRCQATFRAVDKVSTPGGKTTSIASFAIDADRAGLA